MSAEGTWRAFLPLDDEVLVAQCEVDRFRTRGPGGQHRNKVETAVRLRHLPTGLTGEATETRSQHTNRVRALGRLRLAIALGLRAAAPPGEPLPSELEALDASGRITVGTRDRRRLMVLAAMLDVLAADGWQVGQAALRLGCSTAALSRLLTGEPPLLAEVNRQRGRLGLRPLRPSE